MDFHNLLQIAQEHTEVGIFILSFLDACISPILPDIIFIPAIIAKPSSAIYLALLATVAATLGSFVGYFIGYQFSDYAQRKIIPPKHMQYIRNLVDKYGGWAVFFGAMAPIPYKIVAISAGVLRLNIWLYTLATILGRAKRFLIIGIPVYFFGPLVLPLIQKYSKLVAASLAIIMLVSILYLYYRYKATNKKIKLTS